MKATVKRIEELPKLKKLIRVAAYARVSTQKDAMLHSLSQQIDYYKDLIKKNPNWSFAGVYADEAFTGTKNNRPQFQLLIEECKKGNVDLIITKSISRFARNTVTMLETVRELKKLNVDVFFEEQDIHSISGEGEMILTFLASFAQEESRSASENLKWRIRNNFKKGLAWNTSVFGYKFAKGTFEVIPDEAFVVKDIFSLYLSGLGTPAISKILNDQNIHTKHGNKWNFTAVRKVLNNYTYTGNLMLQTTFKDNHLTKRKKINNGELPKYHVEDTHEAIIDLETFNKVQNEIKRRASLINKKNKTLVTSCFTSLLTCSICGKHYHRKTTPYSNYWICPTYSLHGKKYCESKQVPEQALLDATKRVLKKDVIIDDDVKNNIKNIVVKNNNTLVFYLFNGEVLSETWAYKSRSESWTNEMKNKARENARKSRC